MISFQALDMISPYLVVAVSIIVVGLLLLPCYLAIVVKRSSAIFIDLLFVLGFSATILMPPLVGLIIGLLGR